jgi:hypothetical protein
MSTFPKENEMAYLDIPLPSDRLRIRRMRLRPTRAGIGMYPLQQSRCWY